MGMGKPKVSLAERLAAKKAEVERVRVEQIQKEEERAKARKEAAEKAASAASRKAQDEAAELAQRASTNYDAGRALRALAESRGTDGENKDTRVLTEAERKELAEQEAGWAVAAEAAAVAARVAEAAEQQLDEKQERIVRLISLRSPSAANLLLVERNVSPTERCCTPQETYLQGVSEENPFKLAADEPAFVRQLASTLTERSIAVGDCMITKGAVGEEMFFIISGEAHVLTTLDDAAPMATLGPNDFCGEEALLLEAPRSAYVRAAGAGPLIVLALSKKDLLLVLHGHPALADVILAPISQRNAKRARFEARIERVTAYVKGADQDNPFIIAVYEPAFVR